MTDRLDARIRELTVRLIQMSPEAPPFPEETVVQLRPSVAVERPPKRQPRLVWALAAVAVLAAIAVPTLLLGGPSSNVVDDATTITLPGTATTLNPTTTPATAVPSPDILGSLFGEPGQMIDITPPDQRRRGAGYTVTPFGSAAPAFWLIAAVDGVDGEAQWGPWEGGASLPDITITGSGPDRVILPESAAPGEYLVCQIDESFCWTLQLVESAVRSFSIDTTAATPVDLAPADVTSTGWGNGEYELGLSETGFGPCCFDVTSDGGIVFLDEQNQRLMHWLPGGASVFPLATFQPAEFVADAMAVGHDDRIYVLGMSNRPGRPHDLLIIGQDGSVDGPYETIVDSNANMQATANGVYAGSVPVEEGQPVEGWIPVATSAGAPVPVPDQQPVAALPVDDRSLRIDFAADGTIIALLYQGGDSVPIEYRIPGEYFLAGSFVQNEQSTVLLVLGTSWSADEPADFLIVRAALEGETAVSEVFRITGRRWAEMSPFGRIRLEGSSLFFMSTTTGGTEVARYELPG